MLLFGSMEGWPGSTVLKIGRVIGGKNLAKAEMALEMGVRWNVHAACSWEVAPRWHSNAGKLRAAGARCLSGAPESVPMDQNLQTWKGTLQNRCCHICNGDLKAAAVDIVCSCRAETRSRIYMYNQTYTKQAMYKTVYYLRMTLRKLRENLHLIAGYGFIT